MRRLHDGVFGAVGAEVCVRAAENMVVRVCESGDLVVLADVMDADMESRREEPCSDPRADDVSEEEAKMGGRAAESDAIEPDTESDGDAPPLSGAFVTGEDAVDVADDEACETTTKSSSGMSTREEGERRGGEARLGVTPSGEPGPIERGRNFGDVETRVLFS